MRLFFLGMRLLVCAATFQSSASFAYNLFEFDWSYQKNPMQAAFVICEAGAPSGAADRIKQAAAKWNYAKFQFHFDKGRCLVDPPTTKPDGINYISFVDLGKGPPALSDARQEKAGSSKMIECDMRFHSQRKWYTGEGAPPSDSNDLLSVAMHEFGHCLGLNNVSEADVVMNEKLDQGKTRRALAADDIAGRNKIYGAN
jgi:Matrixin